jgi:hypothetical protein
MLDSDRQLQIVKRLHPQPHILEHALSCMHGEVAV